MEVKDLLRLTTKRYVDLENECGLKHGYLKNRRHNKINMMPAKIVVDLARAVDIDFFTLISITTDDVDLRNIVLNK